MIIDEVFESRPDYFEEFVRQAYSAGFETLHDVLKKFPKLDLEIAKSYCQYNPDYDLEFDSMNEVLIEADKEYDDIAAWHRFNVRADQPFDLIECYEARRGG